MIVAAGLTPAWQQIVVLDGLQLGEVNRAREVHWCGSGKVLNVGIALHHLGGPCQTVSLIGGLAHEAVEKEFAQLGIPRRWVPVDAATRVCTTLLASGGTATEVVQNAQPVSEEDVQRFRKAYWHEVERADVVVLSGSLPSGTRPTFYRDLIDVTRCPVVLDARGEELLWALERKPLVVKPNRDELAATVGRSLEDVYQLHQAMHELNERGAEWVVVTQGADVVWASCSGRLYEYVPPEVEKIVNPIGCGDCLAAGLAWAIQGGFEMPDAIRFGMAAAADNLSQLLPARLDPRRVAMTATTISGGPWHTRRRQ